MMKILLLLTTLFTLNAHGQSAAPDFMYDGKTGKMASFAKVLSSVKPGTIVILSEIHNLKSHHEKQKDFLKLLPTTGLERMSVGMEFFFFPDQKYIAPFASGKMEESQFLKLMSWGGNDFSSYKEQVLFPYQHGGETLALNAPRSLTGKIAKQGLDSLTAEEKSLLPPQFTMGNDLYLERFKQTMGGHVPPEKIANYFQAQSVWDDTMAFTATKYMREHSEQALVIIVGDFHAIYGGGLPDRLKARGAQDVLTISQVNLKDLTVEERVQILQPDPIHGVRADYIWTSEE